MRYILVSVEDSTIRKPIEVPDAIVMKIKKKIRQKPIKRKTQKLTVQTSKAVIRKHGPVHNNNKRKSRPL